MDLLHTLVPRADDAFARAAHHLYVVLASLLPAPSNLISSPCRMAAKMYSLASFGTCLFTFPGISTYSVPHPWPTSHDLLRHAPHIRSRVGYDLACTQVQYHDTAMDTGESSLPHASATCNSVTKIESIRPAVRLHRYRRLCVSSPTSFAIAID